MDNNNEELKPAESPEKQPKSASTFFSDVREIAESTIITVFVIVLLFTYLLHPVNVVGSSMVPTLNDSDKVFMSTIVGGYSYGDIIIIENDASYLKEPLTGQLYEASSGQLNERIIKRVIACGGQVIDIDFETGQVSVDGKVLDEPYINEITRNNDGAFQYPLEIPEGYYFVMGDNRNHSSDSRKQLVGLIKKEQIYGKAVMRYSPFSEFKIL